jgi:hypothetical protein
MTPCSSGNTFRMWSAAWPLARVLILAQLPVPDLISRYRVRHMARGLVKCDPWPRTEATGTDAAGLALLKLLFLQKETHKAVRTHQDEAAAMLARVSMETLIAGLYCIYEPTAVARLQGEQVRALPFLLEFLVDAAVIPRDVLDECVRRLEAGTPARGPSVESMSVRVDAAMGASLASGLYKRFYRPASHFALHAGAGSLLRHVRGDGRITSRPTRLCGRRAPVRIADACLGGLTAVLASKAGVPYQYAAKYADRHGGRSLAPIASTSLSGIGQAFRLKQVPTVIRRFRSFGEYVQSGQDANEPEARVARIREYLEWFLAVPGLGIPPGALDPFLDYIAAKLAMEGVVPPRPAGASSPRM